MTKYLYGAAVQGIQNFIFQTNDLKDIVGASELVENICTIHFAKLLYGASPSDDKLTARLNQDEHAIIHAAGNIKYIFDNEEECKRLVMHFPKRVIEYAPGITVSQAVVAFEESDNFSSVIDKLENRLRTQRNKHVKATTVGLMGILRSRQTGLPVVECHKDEYMDEGTFNKRYHRDWDGTYYSPKTTKKLCMKAFGKNDLKADPNNIKDSEIAYDTTNLTDKNDWIAIIHADGNGLGQVVQKVGKNKEQFRKFSQLLDEATVQSAQEAFAYIEQNYSWGRTIPIRPVVLGGDDLTVICRGDLALDYAKKFIERFEENTAQKLGKDILLKGGVFEKGEVRDRLTACAGIAYIKSSYPFYYGYQLAEALCKAAKADAKASPDVQQGLALPASCIMFHKVQDSFVEDYKTIIERELTPNCTCGFKFGPYYINKCPENRWSVAQLLELVSELKGKEGNTVKSGLRKWMTLLHDNPEMAKQKLQRLLEITTMPDFVKRVTEDRKRGEQTVYPTYDILAINTIINQETKQKEE